MAQKKKKKKQPSGGGAALQQTDADLLSDQQLVEKLASFGVFIDRPQFDQLSAKVLSIEELALELYSPRPGALKGKFDRDWVRICLRALWQRWCPGRPSMESLEDRIEKGYLVPDPQGVRLWLEAFRDMVQLMRLSATGDIEEFEEKFYGPGYLLGWLRNFESNLSDACEQDPTLYPQCISFCEEFIQRFGDRYPLGAENFRCAMAELYFESGDKAKAEALFGDWLTADPEWGMGWTGFAELYHVATPATADAARWESILKQALAIPTVRDREFILHSLYDCLMEQGRREEADALGLDLVDSEVESEPEPPPVPVRSTKVGRNEPCPCGSGSKYKKCCLGKVPSSSTTNGG